MGAAPEFAPSAHDPSSTSVGYGRTSAATCCRCRSSSTDQHSADLAVHAAPWPYSTTHGSASMQACMRSGLGCDAMLLASARGRREAGRLSAGWYGTLGGMQPWRMLRGPPVAPAEETAPPHRPGATAASACTCTRHSCRTLSIIIPVRHRGRSASTITPSRSPPKLQQANPAAAAEAAAHLYCVRSKAGERPSLTIACSACATAPSSAA